MDPKRVHSYVCVFVCACVRVCVCGYTCSFAFSCVSVFCQLFCIDVVCV